MFRTAGCFYLVLLLQLFAGSMVTCASAEDSVKPERMLKFIVSGGRLYGSWKGVEKSKTAPFDEYPAYFVSQISIDSTDTRDISRQYLTSGDYDHWWTIHGGDVCFAGPGPMPGTFALYYSKDKVPISLKLEPVTGEIMGNNSGSGKDVRYDVIVHSLKDEFEAWVIQKKELVRWRFNRKRGLDYKFDEKSPHIYQWWDRVAAYPLNFNGRFIVIPEDKSRNRFLVLLANGKIYRLNGTESKLLTGLHLTLPKTQPGADVEKPDKKPSRLIVLHDAEKHKYAIFTRRAGKLVLQKVLDDNKKNVEPFLPADRVDKKYARLMEKMVTEAERDEQRALKAGGILEENRQSPKHKTLKERLSE
jgi:hypothetical protein